MRQTDLDLLVLRPLTCDDVAQISESICSINSVVSMVQTIEVAVHSIRQTLMSMEELVTKAVKRYFTSTEKIRMQQELQQLANHVNQIVNDTCIISRTDLSKNKLLSPEGRDIDTHIGYGDEIHIPACDMTFPIEQVDLTKNGRDALTIVKHALGNVNEFMNCLESGVNK